MKTGKAAIYYSVFIGIAMLGMWTGLLVSGQVPELETEPISTSFHIFAEFLTATLLITGGFGLLTNRSWGFQVYLVSMGMLLYAVLNACGYYAQKNEWVMGYMFMVLALLTAFFIMKEVMKGAGRQQTEKK
jgi:hypothetical protein